MTYHHSKPRKSLLSRKNIVFIVLVSLGASVLFYMPIRSFFTQVVYAGAIKIWTFGGDTARVFHSFAENFRTKSSLANDNEFLLAEVNHMRAQVLDRNLLAQKVIQLEGALGRSSSGDRVVADVVVGQGRSPYDTLVIDAGAEDGINLGYTVVYGGSGAVGEIVEVSASSSKVKLYSSPNMEHLVNVGSYNIPATSSGRGMGNFEAKVPQDSMVTLGDNVISTKDGLILGTVSLVEEKPAEPFKRIFFRLPFNITEIQSVEVIMPSMNNSTTKNSKNLSDKNRKI